MKEWTQHIGLEHNMKLKRNYQIFLSYRRIGGEYAAAYLKTELSNMGYRVFLDTVDLHDGIYSEDIEKTLGYCMVLVVILSENVFDNSIKNPEKDWIIREYSLMKKRERAGESVKIIPIKLRGYQTPDKEQISKQIEKISADDENTHKKQYLEDLIELLNSNYIPFVDTRLSSGVLGKLVSWMQLTPIMEEDKLWEMAKDDPVAMNELGLMYERGDIVRPDGQGQREAYNCYLKAASHDEICPAALYNLGDIYEKCSENISLLEEFGIDDYLDSNNSIKEIMVDLKERAVKFYKKSAEISTSDMEHGYLPALYRLGNLCEDEADYIGALRYYEKAAGFGYPYAYNACGFFYKNGIGCKENRSKARKYYEKAKNAGIPEGKYNYAKIQEEDFPEESICQYEQLISEGTGNLTLTFYALASCYEKQADMYGDNSERKRYIGKAIANYQQAYNCGYEQAGSDLERCKEEYFKE